MYYSARCMMRTGGGVRGRGGDPMASALAACHRRPPPHGGGRIGGMGCRGGRGGCPAVAGGSQQSGRFLAIAASGSLLNHDFTGRGSRATAEAPPTLGGSVATTTATTTVVGPVHVASEGEVVGGGIAERARGLRTRAMHVLRIVLRALHLSLNLAPLALLYPMHRLLGRSDEASYGDGAAAIGGDDDEALLMDWWLKLCYWCVENNGAMTIKLLQWASSRPDLFGRHFCSIFSKLQDEATPHSWKHTKRIMAEAYGKDWEDRIQLGEVLGSGCIGQVYKGIATDERGGRQQVAVKVMHPNVRDKVDTDLDLLRLSASMLNRLPFNLGADLRWMNLSGVVEEFATLLTTQLDFRTEADHLDRFNANFRDDPGVTFPKVVRGYEPTSDVLVETFCDGVPLKEFVEEHADDADLLKRMSQIATRTVCRMIFDHNFIHGDLHPGNVFVAHGGDKFILLDVGMVTEYSDEEHELVVDILANFIRRDGRRAAELMISDSNRRLEASGEYAMNEELYIEKIERICDIANKKDFFFQNLGSYISYICEAASTHHVMMNEAFVSMALAVKVQEGVALLLDPNATVWIIANPIILRSELRRRLSRAVDRVCNEIEKLPAVQGEHT